MNIDNDGTVAAAVLVVIYVASTRTTTNPSEAK